MAQPARLAKALRRWCESHQETYDKVPDVKHHKFTYDLDAVALIAQELAPPLFISYLAMIEGVIYSLGILNGQLENLQTRTKLTTEQQEAINRLSKHLPIYRKKPHLLLLPVFEAFDSIMGDPAPNYGVFISRVHKALCQTMLAGPDQRSYRSESHPSGK